MQSAAHPILLIERLRVVYKGATTPIIDGASLALNCGEIGCVVGRSGGGKTTLLRAIAGFIAVEAGTIEIAGAVVSGPRFTVATEKRGIGLVFQDYALFPHLRVDDNIGFGLRHLGPAERHARVREMVELVGLGTQTRSYPHELSGGQQQRVALARALALDPPLMIYDEPLTGLDPIAAGVITSLIRRLNDTLGLTSVIVTHHVHETLPIADRAVVIANGRIVFSGAPAALQASDDPLVRQFLRGDPDGPIAFDSLGAFDGAGAFDSTDRVRAQPA